MRAYELKCEYLKNPVGIDVKKPRLYWKCEGGIRQTAYQINAAACLCNLENGTLLWDSGEVGSGESLHVEYPLELKTRDVVFWRVRLKDESGNMGEWSETAFFEMGLLNKSDIAAKWIDPEETHNPDEQLPVSLIRCSFFVKEGFISARLYVSALGIYEAGINGKRVGDQILTPGFTDMQRRRQYQTYDVTNLLSAGDNAIGISLADGWARGRLGFAGHRNQFSDSVALWAQLIVTYSDGDKIAVITDESWKTTKNGPCRLSDMRDGEIYDARLELDGWDHIGFDDSGWESVTVCKWDGELVGTQSAPVRELGRIKGKLLPTPDGRNVIDFGQNISGYVEFCGRGNAGHTINLTHGEALDAKGNFTMCNFGPDIDQGSTKIVAAKQKIRYTFSGKGYEKYKPSFIYMGFRYVLIENWPGEVDPDDFTAIVISTDVSRNVSFSCSNELLNHFFSNTMWSQLSNFVDIPTDCPHRERMGWTGDAQLFARTAITNYDAASFFTKWLRDVKSSQLENGMILNTVPGTCPKEGEPIHPGYTSPGWGDSVTIIPYNLYETLGDKRLLDEMYQSMKRWVDYEASAAASTSTNPEDPLDKYVWDSGFHWGEWLEPIEMTEEERQAEQFKTKPEVATAYFAFSSGLLAEIAEILGYAKDAEKYQALSENVRAAYVKNFTNDGIVENADRQARYVRPLALSLLPEKARQTVADNLAKELERNGYHIGTGFLSTPYLCEVLTKGGHLETAYKTLQQTTPPSWLYSVTRGATTTWETWLGYSADGEPYASHNHYAFGSIFEWIYRYMVGIDTYIEHPAYKRFKIAPNPGGGISFAKAEIDTIRGQIYCEWTYTDDVFTLNFSIPANTEADIILPKGMDKIEEDSGLLFAQTDKRMCARALPGDYLLRCRISN